MPERNQIIDDLRGICMLGVIGIHVGSFVLEAPYPNSFLYMLLEILSRYSVPAFFFISGYGLFCQYRPETTIAYLPFLKKRLQSVGLPYVIWSLFYLLYFSAVMPGCINWQPANILFLLFYGLACYHLYFMVILLWFYFTFPLWHKLFSFFSKTAVLNLVLCCCSYCRSSSTTGPVIPILKVLTYQYFYKTFLTIV